VTRGKGIADKVAKHMEALLAMLNTVHSLSAYPLTLEGVMEKMSEGKALLKKLELAKETSVLAEAAVSVSIAAGGASKKSVLGLLAQTMTNGTVPTKRIAHLTRTSPSYVRECRRKECERQAKPDPESDVFRMKRTPGPRGVAAPSLNIYLQAEIEATRDWFLQMNPARSGDTQERAWMVKGKIDFYHEDYRSVDGQIAIFELALQGSHSLELRKEMVNFTSTFRVYLDGREQGTRWLRNLKTYWDASRTAGGLNKLRIKALSLDDLFPMSNGAEDKKKKEANAKELLETVMEQLEQEPINDPMEEEPTNASEDDAHLEEERKELDVAGVDHLGNYTIFPRTRSTFYRTLLKGMSIRARPPHDYCDRCAKAELGNKRASELQKALYGNIQDLKIIAQAGGETKAREELRDLNNKLPDLNKHKKWAELRRPWLKTVEAEIAESENTALLQLDYGAFNDSTGKKVSVWSATVLPPGGEVQHIDFCLTLQIKNLICLVPKRMAKPGFTFSNNF
jgi:hypothetical protein